MLKRLIMMLLAISMLALFSPDAARAACYEIPELTPPGCCFTTLAGVNCIYCPATSYSVSGEPTTPDQCTWWWPGGAEMGAVVKDLLKEDTKDCEGEGCAEVLATVVGTVDRWGEPVLNPLDLDAFSEWYVSCGNKGKGHPEYWPDSSGNPSVLQTRTISTNAQIDNLRKHVSRVFADVEPQFCPDSFPYQEVHLSNGNGVGCIFPRGVDEVSPGVYKGCYERNAAGECKYSDGTPAYDPLPGQWSIDDTAIVVHLEEQNDPPNFEEFEVNDPIGVVSSIVQEFYPPGEFPDGFCNYLYSEFKKSQKK